MESIFLHVPTLFSDNGSVNSKHAQPPAGRGGAVGGSGWGRGGRVLQISSDGDDQRIFWGVKFLILGIFLGKKIWQVFFGVA